MNIPNEIKSETAPEEMAVGQPPVSAVVPPALLTAEAAGKPDRGRAFWIGLIIILALISGVLAYLAYEASVGRYRQSTASDESNDWDKLRASLGQLGGGSSAAIPTKPRLIDGVAVPEGEENLPPVAVVIDNHIDARPPSGLSRAQLVFEAEAEGGLSRYLAFFAASTSIPEIGPVRSARPYFIDWAREFDAVFTHCGGSPEALARLAAGEIEDLNEFYSGGYFWRAGNRNAPHNVMTGLDRLRDYQSKSGAGAGDYFSWSYRDPAPGASSTDLELPKFTVVWKYQTASNTYERWLGGKVHRDADGAGITASNVAVIYADTAVLDEKLRIEIKTIGEGRALLCQDGSCRSARWKKPSLSSRTRFYFDKDEALFIPGTTWIEVVRKDAEVKTNDQDNAS